MRRWELEASEYYVLNVTQTSHGDNSHVFSPPHKVTPGGKTVGVRLYNWNKVKEGLAIVNIALLIFAGVAFVISAAIPHLSKFIHLRSEQG
ncbi:hypothetical protein Q5P01_002783 [Channa striata]|uniref:Uncharacterized protein n=1 Tax=Channa striata TaxID=64152 RepID=A0AA88NRP3_CHASR|nr:hypothetical protein Q5P01_002783 [Channa striata]